VVLFAGPNPDPDRVAALERAADEVHRRGLRARVCMARVGIDRAAPAGGFAHVDSVEWRRALGEALGEVEAGRLRALVRKAVPRVVLLRSGSFDELTSGEPPQQPRARLPFGRLGILSHVDQLPCWTGAEAHDLIDNLGRYAAPPPAPSLLPSLTASNFTRATHASPLMLVAFTVRWCARCADLALQLQSAAALFPSLQPAVAASIAVVDMDDPRNSPLAREVRRARGRPPAAFMAARRTTPA